MREVPGPGEQRRPIPTKQRPGGEGVCSFTTMGRCCFKRNNMNSYSVTRNWIHIKNTRICWGEICIYIHGPSILLLYLHPFLSIWHPLEGPGILLAFFGIFLGGFKILVVVGWQQDFEWHGPCNQRSEPPNYISAWWRRKLLSPW